MTRFYNPNPQFTDSNGRPLDGGKLYSYTVGTTTPAATYSDNGQTTANANPIILDSEGRAGNIFFSGQLRFVLDDANDVEQWDRDFVGDSANEGEFSDWSNATTYGVGDFVNYQGVNYVSLTASNLNNIPSASSTRWSAVNIIRTWNTNETYDNQEIVIRNGGFYSSRSASNTGNDPTTDLTNWLAMQDDAAIVITGPSAFIGHGVTSVTTSGNDHDIVFENAAIASNRQVITIGWPAPNSADHFQGGYEIVSTTAITLHQYFGAVATPTASTSYPISVRRKLV